MESADGRSGREGLLGAERGHLRAASDVDPGDDTVTRKSSGVDAAEGHQHTDGTADAEQLSDTSAAFDDTERRARDGEPRTLAVCEPDTAELLDGDEDRVNLRDNEHTEVLSQRSPRAAA